MKTRFTKFLILIVVGLILTKTSAQNSVNVYGNVNNTNNTSNIQACDSGYLAFGNINLLSVQYFDFKEGEKFSMSFKQNLGNGDINIFGVGGVMENDSVFLVLGRVGKDKVGIIKATKTGRIIWSKWYNTGLDEYPEKIVRLKNGDYLISVKTNVSYYEFGEWGYRSGIFRISPNRTLKWYRDLDYRTANTFSTIVGMHETKGNNLIITQKYGAKLGVFKLTPNGDSIISILSNQDSYIQDSYFDSKDQTLYAISSDKKIDTYDTSLNVKLSRTIAHVNLNSFSNISVINDSTVLIGGKYNNDACLIYCDKQFNVLSCHYKKFLPRTASSLLGISRINDIGYSIIYPFNAISKHTSSTAPLCFNVVNGSQFAANSVSKLTFKSHVRIKGTATWDNWDNILSRIRKASNGSSNCLNNDLGFTPYTKNYNNVCPQFSFIIQVANHSIGNVPNFKIKYFINKQAFDTTFTYQFGFGTKQTQLITFTNISLNKGKNMIHGYLVNPNDEFKSNDSFKITVNVRPIATFNIIGKDSFCEGESIVLNVNGKTAAYDWFRNNVVFKTNGTNSLTINNNGKYFAKLRDSSCFYNSDTINIRKIAKPSKPAITKNGQKLTSNALGLNTWFYKNLPIDSNKTEINLMGDGAYFVKSINGSGCFSNSDVFNYNASFIDLISMENKVRVINQNTIVYSGNEAVSISLFSLDGKLLSKNIIGENTLKVAFPQGIYLVCVEYNAQKHYLKVMLDN